MLSAQTFKQMCDCHVICDPQDLLMELAVQKGADLGVMWYSGYILLTGWLNYWLQIGHANTFRFLSSHRFLIKARYLEDILLARPSIVSTMRNHTGEKGVFNVQPTAKPVCPVEYLCGADTAPGRSS